jgi:hypothetical protein
MITTVTIEPSCPWPTCGADLTATITPGYLPSWDEPGAGDTIETLTGCAHAARWTAATLRRPDTLKLERAVWDAWEAEMDRQAEYEDRRFAEDGGR